MIFLTVGTQFPFDRLVKAVDDAAGKGAAGDEVFAQTGGGTYRPRNMKYVEKMERGEFAECVAKARAIIGHAGMGTILVAVEAGKPLLVMPRRAEFGEIVNDHQLATAAKSAHEWSHESETVPAPLRPVWKKLGGRPQLQSFRHWLVWESSPDPSTQPVARWG